MGPIYVLGGLRPPWNLAEDLLLLDVLHTVHVFDTAGNNSEQNIKYTQQSTWHQAQCTLSSEIRHEI